jgi:hypothetical protein
VVFLVTQNDCHRKEITPSAEQIKLATEQKR